jgi:type I restriction enzyme S subunit
MEEWKKYKLGEIAKIVGGTTPYTARKEYYGGDIPWITPKDLSNFTHRYIENGERNITKEGFNSCSAYLLPSNSVLFSSRAPIGYVAITKTSMCTNQGFKSLIPNPQFINHIFLYYLLKYEKGRIEGLGSGTTFKEVSGTVMRNVEVRIPSIVTQLKIVQILDCLDSKIETNSVINDNLEQQAQAIYKSWFIDFEPFKGGKFVDSELGKIPEGWRVGTIGDYCKVRSGFAFKSSSWTNRGLKVIKIKNISSNGTLEMSDCSYVLKADTSKASDFRVTTGDVLIAMTGATIGKFCIVPYLQEDIYVNQRVGKFFTNGDPIETLPFLHNTLKREGIIGEIISRGQGSAQPNISSLDIESIKIIIPDNRVLKSFNQDLKANYLLMLKNEQSMMALSELRDTLLPKLMSGELKISNLHS